MSRALAKDAIWVMVGQGAAALASLFGIRLLTEFVSPENFGLMSLTLGAAALVFNIGCAPITQAAIYLFPSAKQQGKELQLRRDLIHCLKPLCILIVGVIVAGAVVAATAESKLARLLPVLALILACDCIRAIEMTLLNAARRHQRYSLWAAGEACLRPLLATAALIYFGESALSALIGYFVASALLLIFFSAGSLPEFIAAGFDGKPNGDVADKQRMWRYALPLIPLGLVDWTNGIADRYIIGSFLSLADAGVYAAVYGLASRPFLILGQTIELAIRPVYQAAVSAEQHAKANKLLTFWFAAVATAGLLGVLCLSFWCTGIANVLLGAEYRRGAELIPWIATGYAVLAISQLFQRVCFAHGNSRAVLWIQTTATIVGLAATVIGVKGWGLLGAAAAIPVAFSVQLIVSVVGARKIFRRNAQSFTAGPNYG